MPLNHPISEQFHFRTVTANEVHAILMSIPSNKSPGHDKIPIKVYKDCLPSILSSITDLINNSHSSSVFPIAWKIAEVVPIDLFTDTAAILNSIVLTEKLWAAEGAIAGKFIVYTAFRIHFYCLFLIFHNKYYKRYIFPSGYSAVVPMVIEKLLLKVITPQYSF